MLQKRSVELALPIFDADFFESGLRYFFFYTFLLTLSLEALIFYSGGILLLWSLDASITDEQRASTFWAD